jgi:hypothetical protein
MKDLKLFYNYIKVNHCYNCLNTLQDGRFSKNLFVKDYNTLQEFVNKNKNINCYINYQSLKEPINRKTENVHGVHLLAFDIECQNKQRPETQENLDKSLQYIHDFIKIKKINNYMIVLSGNGYHLYIKLGDKIKRDNILLKETYKKIIKYYSDFIYNQTGGFLSCDDRKDIAGILRLPETYNTKAKRFVKIIEIKEDSNNVKVRKDFFQILREVKRKQEHFANIENLDDSSIQFPRNIDELLNNPLVKIIFDSSLEQPTVGNWHNSVIFALQNLIYHSGLQKTYEITELTREINNQCIEFDKLKFNIE